MARKKKEEVKEEIPVSNETVATAPDLEIAVTAVEKTGEENPKPQKKTVKKPTKKKEKQDKKDEPVQEPVEEPKAESAKKSTEDNAVNEEKTAEQKQEIPAKPKRGRKPTAKKETKKTPDSEPAVANEEVKQTSDEVASEEKAQPQGKKAVTKAEKNETIKTLVKELLAKRPYKWSELLDESCRLYEQKIEEKDGHVANDVRGRVGSVFDLMKKDGEVIFEGGMYALKSVTDKKTEENSAPTPKKPAQKTKTEKSSVKNQETLTPAPIVESEKAIEETPTKEAETPKKQAEVAPVFDLSLLLGDKTKPKAQEKKQEEPKKEENKKSDVVIMDDKDLTFGFKPKEKEEKPAPKTQVKKEQPERKKATGAQSKDKKVSEKRATRAHANKLKEAFLKKIRTLGGKYFEYYSIYLLERYSLRNGRRVDGFKISGGDNDGGIDGEIEVTDRIGFKETIYVQAKNWKPIYGKEDSWVIGETTLREFIGAVAYRQAKEGKQRCRGIFITTSYFTAGSKEILEQMSDSFVGYDGDDLFETAKECSFGLIEKDGEWQLDERLLSGDKAFFNLYD